MDVIRHQNADQFLSYNQEMLQKNEASNNLILGLAFNLQNDLNFYGEQAPVFMSVLDNGVSKYCCLQTPPHNLIVYGESDLLDRATNIVCDYLINSELDIPGVNGSKDMSQRFSETWTSLLDVKSNVKMNTMVYRLDQLNVIDFCDGQLRQAAQSDMDTISEWLFIFNNEVFDEITRAEAEEDAYKRINLGEIYVWENEELLSMAASARPTENGITVNHVFTPRHLRKRGFARSCVAALSKLLLNKYKFCTLFTDLENPTSNKIYKEIGYKEVCAFQHHTFIR